MLAGCTQNTLTGSMDSCNNDGCVCKEGFAPPDCCNCDLTGVSGRPHYLDPVTNKCTREPICMHGMIGIQLLTHKPVTLINERLACTACTSLYRMLH